MSLSPSKAATAAAGSPQPSVAVVAAAKVPQKCTFEAALQGGSPAASTSAGVATRTDKGKGYNAEKKEEAVSLGASIFCPDGTFVVCWICSRSHSSNSKAAGEHRVNLRKGCPFDLTMRTSLHALIPRFAEGLSPPLLHYSPHLQLPSLLQSMPPSLRR